jgi:hypothetical protein
VYKLSYAQTIVAHKLEGKLYLDVCEYKGLNVTELENVGPLTSHNPMGLHGLLQG